MFARIALVTGVALITLTACGNATPRSDGGSSNKYTQTWTKSYTDTSCDDWISQMTDKQQWAAAADMLAGARDKGDGGTGVPDDDLVTDFRDGVTNVCGAPADVSESIAEVAAGLYLTERDRFAPQ